MRTHAPKHDLSRASSSVPASGHSVDPVALPQRALGNRAMQRILADAEMGAPLQTKLLVGSPSDRFEQEAHRVSEQVSRIGEPRVQRQLSHVGAEAAGQFRAPPIVAEVLNTPGQPLERETRVSMEHRFGHKDGLVADHDLILPEQLRALRPSHRRCTSADRTLNLQAYAPGEEHEGHVSPPVCHAASPESG